MRVCVGGSFFDFPPTLFSWAEGAFSKHNVDCSCASQEMPQLQITDQAKHVWRWALRGINSPPFPPSALTPATTFITGRENIVSGPLTNTCQFQEKELLFFQPRKENKVFPRPVEKEWEEKIRRRSTLSFFLSLSLSFFSLTLLLLTLTPSVPLWPLGAALPLI